MHPPRKAIILAAGFGTRLEPLTRTTPKCLLPLWGRPILDHTLATLAAWGVRDVLLNLHHAPQPVWEYARQAALRGPLRIALSHEPEILGTGGALQRAAWFLDDAPFWMVNGDIVFDVNPRPLQRALLTPRTLAALWMTTQSGPRTVELNHDGTVRNFRSTSPGSPHTHTFCGLQLLAPAILQHLPQTPYSSIVAAYESAAQAGACVTGIDVPGAFWIDIGTPAGLLDAHAQTLAARQRHAPGGRAVPPQALRTMATLRRQGVSVQGFVALGRDVRVERGTILRHVVAMDGARIARGARVEEAILAPGVQVFGTVHRLAVPLPAAQDAELSLAAARLGWPPAQTVVQPLAPRGSARSFTRLVCRNRRAIVIRYTLDRPENARFVGHARYLTRLGVRVPQILADDPVRHLTVIEDLGDRDLAAAIRNRSAAEIARHYGRVVDAVAHWHRTARRALRQAPPLEPPFTPALYRWEHELFRTHYTGARLGIPPQACAPALRELRKLAKRLDGEPQTIVHRDLQSSNILLAGREPAFIDFQGMRLGPAAYDVASLLADPYVSLSPHLQDVLLLRYARAAGIADLAHFQETFWHAVVQRLVQALGAYGRLSRLPGMANFACHIPPALDMLDRAMARLYTLPQLRDLLRTAREREAQRRGTT